MLPVHSFHIPYTPLISFHSMALLQNLSLPKNNQLPVFHPISHGTYALIDKGENRDRKIRKPRPSIRAQLKADKAKTAPKKAAAKTKNHDMEV